VEELRRVIFYKIEKAIKAYRQFAQKRLKAAGLKITVDQWLTLSSIHESPTISQKELAATIFKDEASVTRIIALLEKAGYLSRIRHESDQRRSSYGITLTGGALLNKARKVVAGYRKTALGNIPAAKLRTAGQVLEAIISNCIGDEKDR
jgi:MarR family transcriptional regulator, transcriptional regulator for hemolysin